MYYRGIPIFFTDAVERDDDHGVYTTTIIEGEYYIIEDDPPEQLALLAPLDT